MAQISNKQVKVPWSIFHKPMDLFLKSELLDDYSCWKRHKIVEKNGPLISNQALNTRNSTQIYRRNPKIIQKVPTPQW